MAAIKIIDVTAYGQSLSGIRIEIGATVRWNITCQNPLTRAPINLLGHAVQMGVSALKNGQPVTPPVIARAATVINALAGTIYVPWANGDTVPGGTPLAPGRYYLDLWLTEASTGDRLALLFEAFVELVAVATLPGQLVTALPAQPPLGQGAAGAQGNPGPAANWQATGTSSGATPLNLDIPYTIPTERAALVRVFVVARRASDGLVATWELRGTLKRDGAAAAIGGSGAFRVEDEDPDDALIGPSGCVWTVAVTLNSSALRVVFTGDTGAVAVKALAIAMENL